MTTPSEESALAGESAESTPSPSRLEEANQLISELENELQKRPSPSKLQEQIQWHALSTLVEQTRRLASLLGIPRNRLVFIGKVGVGKTTAICHLAGLSAKRRKVKKSKSGTERQVEVTEELLATGAGFTTLCEVEIAPTQNTTRFVIEPLPPDEVRRIVEDFCLAIWKRAFPNSQGNEETHDGGTAPTNFPPELMRAVRNMLKLKEGKKKGEADEAVELASKFEMNGYEQFKVRALELANIEARTESEIPCPPGEPDARSWIKKTFDEMNLMKRATISIPRRIILEVDQKLVTPQVRGVQAVVDTKGIDASQFNRADLDRYLRMDESALCLLTEGFDTAPTDVLPILQRHATPENPLALTKLVLMVLPRAGEPEKVQGQDGKVEDREAGIEFRRRQIEGTLRTYGLADLNIMFFDPLQHFREDSGEYTLPDSEAFEDARADHVEAWASIDRITAARVEAIWKRVLQVRESLNRIRKGTGFRPGEEDLVRQLRSDITEHRQASVSADRFVDRYRALWQGPNARHPMTLRAANNRYGKYPYRNIDVCYDAVPISEELVRASTQKKKDAILDLIRKVRENTETDSDLRELLSVLEKRVDDTYEAMVRKVGVMGQSHLQDAVFFPQDQSSEFWTNVRNRYGQGKGFREDVLNMYQDKLEGMEKFLSEAAERLWRSEFIDPILTFLAN